MTDMAPMTADEAARHMAECPYHLMTENWPDAMMVASKAATEVMTDKEADAVVANNKVSTMDMYWMYRRMCIENAPPKFFNRWNVMNWAVRKANK